MAVYGILAWPDEQFQLAEILLSEQNYFDSLGTVMSKFESIKSRISVSKEEPIRVPPSSPRHMLYSTCMHHLPGKILIIGPSRAGKSYYASAFKEMGLPAVDAESETDLIGWYNDATGELVKTNQQIFTEEWFDTHHFLMDGLSLKHYLSQHDNIILFAHAWNIMDLTAFFDHVFFMHVQPEELERRFTIQRPDRKKVITAAEIEFFRQKHKERAEQATRYKIPFIDASQSPENVYGQISSYLKIHGA